MLFKTETNANLKLLFGVQNKYIEESSQKYTWYFGNKSLYNYTCFTSYTCQDFTNGKKFAVRNSDNSIIYNDGNSSKWYYL